MALTTTFKTNPVKTIIINQTVSTSAAGVGDNNVAGGPAFILSVNINNANGGDATHTKLYNLSSAVAGTNTADVILYARPNGNLTYTFHPPLEFSVGISMVTTTTPGQAGTTAPGTPPAVTLILSETAS